MANKNEQSAHETLEHLTKSEAFFDKNKKAILIAIAAIIIIVLGFFAYRTYIVGPQEQKASTAIARGQEYFNQEMFDKALNGDGAGYTGFVKIASDYSGTDAANLANLYAGLCYANMNKWNDAVKYLDEFDPESDQMISPAAIAALGDAYANVNELDKAVASFKEAADKADSKAADGANNSLSPTFMLKAGIILESQNKKDEALEVYQNIKKKYVNSALVQGSEIDKYIERVSK